MGKRSTFSRRANDAYPTPIEAVRPLVPHLRGMHIFAEPCAGDGALVRHLEITRAALRLRRRPRRRPGCAASRASTRP